MCVSPMNHNSDALDNTIFVGNSKPIMNYITAVVTISHKYKQNREIIVRARGKAISKAVDVVQNVRTQFLPDLQIKDITIGTDEVRSSHGISHVSTIKIILSNPT